MGLLRAAPNDLYAPIREGGGSDSWLWRGEQKASEVRLEVVIGPPIWTSEQRRLHYSLAFGPFFLEIPMFSNEVLEDEQTGEAENRVNRYLDRRLGKATLNYRNDSGGRSQRDLGLKDLKHDQSVLAQFKDPIQYPELTFVGNEFGRIHLYREWSFGRNTPPRLPQKADLPNNYLAEDGSNLGMVLNRLKREPKVKNRFLVALRQLYEGIEDFDVFIEGGTVQVFLQEGNVTMPATRLSDGTLRYLSLLAILCHPTPPPLVCLEEPELGLHPDILPSLAELLREASERCQLIVTTHSDTLVDALTDTPESVVVCQKENGQTTLKRLDKQELAGWLEKYSLGDYWMRGGVGGTRW